ncbi:MAG: DUF1559 domain-containing protein [Planctomycetota bacterium]
MLSDRSGSTRRGLSLVEVLVVFVILGMSLVVFIPALNQMTEGARAAQCQNRLRRLTQGALQFEAARGGLPAGAYLNAAGTSIRCKTVGTYNDGYGTDSVFFGCFDLMGRFGAPNFGWIPLVLPYIDQQDTYNLIDFSMRAQDQFDDVEDDDLFVDRGHPSGRAKPEPFVRELTNLICPSDGGPKTHYDGEGATQGFLVIRRTRGFAKTNYVGFLSVVHMNHFKDAEGAMGGFDLGSPVGLSLAQIPDGTSHTLLNTEVRTMDHAGDSRGVWALAFPGATSIVTDWHPESPTSQYVPDPSFLPRNVALPNSQTFDDVMLGGQTHSSAADKQGMPFRAFNQGGAFLAATARSRHPRGVYATAVDGRAGLISNQIDPLTYVYLVHPRDGRDTDFGDAIETPATIDTP